MAELVIPGNSMPLGSGGGSQSSTSREDMIINKTKEMAFPTEAVISLENFDHHGDRPAGSQNSLADMQNLAGKTLQESYRATFQKSADMTEKISDR